MKNRIFLIAFLCATLIACEERSSFEKIKYDVDYLASEQLEGRETGRTGEKLAAKYIAERMYDIGLFARGTEGYYQAFPYKLKENPHKEASDTAAVISVTNVIGYLDNEAENTIVIGAHYDHLGFGNESSLHAAKDGQIHNGADDNASGVALMLELADRIEGEKDFKSSNYLFIAFSGEEMGLLGSNYFCKNPTIDLSKVNYMINFDMVGRLDTAKGLAINGVGTAENWKNHLEKANWSNLSLIYGESGQGPSDHTSFYLQNIPVLHFFTGQHEDYHKPSDDAEKINFGGILRIADFIERLILEVNSKTKLDFIKTKDEEKDTPRFTVTLGVMPDYLYQGAGMRIDGVTEGKPADKAGFIKGDIVVKMDTLVVDGMQSYMKGLSMFKKGDSTEVVVKREDEELKRMVTF